MLSHQGRAIPSRAGRDALDREVILRAQSERSEAARSAAVTRFMPLARTLARRYRRGEEPLDDLEQVACLGLLKAIDGFDADRGLAFSSYAVPTIVGELRRHFRDKGWTIRVPRDLQELSLKLNAGQERLASRLGREPTLAELAAELAVGEERVLEAREAAYAMHPASLDRPVSAEDTDGDAVIDRIGATEPGFEHADNASLAADLLRRLPDREREAVELRFREELTQAEIGQRIGVSQMHVSRLLRRALNQLAEESGAVASGF